MSFWVGLVIIVLFLETLRIGLSSYLLIHILRGIHPAGDEPQPHIPGAPHARVDWTRERDRLASEAMLAVRRAMDELPAASGDGALRPAIAALDAYVLHHVDEGRA